MGCADEVIFHGEVADVERFFDTHCVFVQPSLAEGMSNVLLEAMACGLPVIATRTGAAEDIIQDSVNGLLVDAGSAEQICDAVRKIISDEEFVFRLGMSARTTIEENYSIDIVAKRYMDMYRELTAS
jgi:glycosyltransferase involved in cell wall biosynthesis